MVQLFFQGPTDGGSANTDAVKARRSLLDKVESIIRSVIKSGGRIPNGMLLPACCGCFLRNSPKKAGSILSKKHQMLEEFFQGNPKRIMQWFGHFAVTGGSTHKKGARALSQFAFLNRDICWEELEWKGKHGQSPAVVATNPHYFRDLDVLQTVENFLDNVPDFWSSEELADSVKDGEILQIDMVYFVDQYMYLMYHENSRGAWQLVEEFLMDEQFSSLSQHLLIHLDEQRLLNFLRALGKLINLNSQCKEMTFPCCWLEVLLSAYGDHISLDEPVLLNCVIAKGRQLWHLMNDEEQEEEKGLMKELLKSTNQLTDADHFALMKGLVDINLPDALKWIGIQSWAVFCELSKECKSADSCEHLFTCNRKNIARLMITHWSKMMGTQLHQTVMMGI